MTDCKIIFLLCFFALSLLCGCRMSNDEIIQQTKKCEAAGFDAIEIIDSFSGITKDIQCTKKKSNS